MNGKSRGKLGREAKNKARREGRMREREEASE